MTQVHGCGNRLIAIVFGRTKRRVELTRGLKTVLQVQKELCGDS